MGYHFEALMEEILLLVSEYPEGAPIEGISRSLNTFRLPILLVKKDEMLQYALHGDIDRCKHLANPYFFMVFGHLDSFERHYSREIQLLVDSATNTEQITDLDLTINRQLFPAKIASVFIQEQPYQLLVVEYRVEYTHLLSSQEKYLLIDLVHHTNDFVGLADDIGNFVYINEAGLKLLKMSPTDVHLLNVWDLHDHKELQQILEVGRREDGSFSWVGQVKIRTHTNQWLICSMSITSHLSEGKNYYATIIRDMSFLKRIDEQVSNVSQKIEETVAQRSGDIIELNIQLLHEIEASERMRYMLQERERRLTTILDTTLDGYFMLDLNLRIEQSNRAFKILVGSIYRDLVGERIMRFITHESKQQLKETLPKVFNGERFIIHLDLQSLSGQFLPCSISLNPYFVEGKLRGIFGFARPLDPSQMPQLGDFF